VRLDKRALFSALYAEGVRLLVDPEKYVTLKLAELERRGKVKVGGVTYRKELA
jgi:hypothetical protein